MKSGPTRKTKSETLELYEVELTRLDGQIQFYDKYFATKTKTTIIGNARRDHNMLKKVHARVLSIIDQVKATPGDSIFEFRDVQLQPMLGMPPTRVA